MVDENNPFDHDRDKQLLVSLSTEFTSTADDAVNAERATEIQEIGRQMQIKLDGQPVTSTVGVKFKVHDYRPFHLLERFQRSVTGRFT